MADSSMNVEGSPVTKAPGSPGSHPHADRPNWRPANTLEDYIANCQEGLEQYSDRRAAKLFGVSRMEIYRWQLMASLPDDLVERLFAARRAGRCELTTK